MRRDFLKLCGLAGLGLAVPFRAREARAAEKKDEPYAGPYYLVVNASGGRDTAYLMDPKGVNGANRLSKKVAIAERMDGKASSPDHDRVGTDRSEGARREQNAAHAGQPRRRRPERGENMLAPAHVSAKALERVTQYIPTTSPKERLTQQA